MADTTYTAAALLAEVNKAITSIMVGGQAYTIGSRSLTRANITELRNLRDELSAEVDAENADANLFGRTYTAFFVGTGR